METGQAVLTYNLDEEYQIRIEKPEEFNQSYFRDVYSQAAKAVAGIVKQENGQKENDNPFLREQKEFNNIVAFIGGRGTGKTSCMVSFAKYLIGKKDEKNKLENFEIKELSEYKFVSLPTIDPSLFEEDENIIEVVLAQMFSDFESILKNSQREVDQDIRRKLIERFDVVYRNLQTIIKGRKNYDGESLETLSKLAQSTKLRENFKDLVHKFTDLKANPENERGNYKDFFLIIPIDDFDLNVKAAAEMSEQIRKYFMIPNVIILMSVNMDQLRDAKERSIRKAFAGMEDFMNEDSAQMAVEYLLKLIPDNRRHYMPEYNQFTKNKANIKNTFIRIEYPPKTNIENKEIKIEEYIFDRIYETTGLIFLPRQEEHHILIPSTLRKLKEFIFFLERRLNNKSDNINHNFEIFREYIIKTYLISKVHKKYINHLNEIVNSDIMRLNNTVINNIHKIITKTNNNNGKESYITNNPLDTFPNPSEDLPDYTLELKELLTRDKNPHNISIGDVLFIINLANKYVNDENFTIFCNSIRLIYTIEIFRLENSKLWKELKTVIGSSLLPPEDLMKIVPFKKYEKSSLKRSVNLSRITFNYNNKESKNNIYKVFVTYNGTNYHYRRRSTRDFYDEYNFSESNDFKLDIFSCFVNIPFLKYDISEKNIKDNKKIKDELAITDNNTLDFIPLHCIDLIEEVFYRSFRFDTNESLYKEYYNIYKLIEERITEALKHNNNAKDKILKTMNNSFIKNHIFQEQTKQMFFSFEELSNTLNNINETTYTKYTTNITNEFINKLITSLSKINKAKKLKNFISEFEINIEQLLISSDDKYLFSYFINQANKQLKEKPDMTLINFKDNNIDTVSKIISKLEEYLN